MNSHSVLTFDPLSTVQLDLSLALWRVRFDHNEGASRHGTVEFPFGAAGAGNGRGCVGGGAGVPLYRARAVNKHIGYRGDARQLVAEACGHRHGRVAKGTVTQQQPDSCHSDRL